MCSMTEEEKLLNTFNARVGQLILQYQEIEKENQKLMQAIEEKNIEIEILKEEINQANKNYANLKLAKMITIGDDEIENAKKRISKLVRDVDKCIALLKV